MRHSLYIIGAGLSKALERGPRIPLMKDFLSVMGEHLDNPAVRVTLARYARESLFRWPVPPELDEFAKHVHERRSVTPDLCNLVAAALRRMPGENVEELLSSDADIFEGKDGRFRFAINAIFAKIGWNVHFEPLTNFLTGQLSRGSSKHTFLDFNYDLLLEHEVSEVSRKHFHSAWDPLSGYGFEAKVAGDNFRVFDSDVQAMGSTLQREPAIQILKPHGSLNWVVPFTGNYQFQDCVPTIYLEGSGLAYSTEYDICFQQAIFIVAPKPKKDCSFSFTKQTLEKEQQAINEADEIYVIGWSMPPSDTNQTDLIRSAVRKPNPAQLTVVNYRADIDYFIRIAELFAVEPNAVRAFNAGFADFSDNLVTHNHDRHIRQSSITNHQWSNAQTH